MTRPTILTAVAIALLLAGCGGGAADDERSSIQPPGCQAQQERCR